MIVMALVTDAYGAGGGIAQYNRDLLMALAKDDRISRIRVLARHGHVDGASPSAKIEMSGVVPGKLAFSWLAAVALWRQRADVIFCGHLFMLPLAILLARCTGAAVWLQVHGIEAWQQPGFLVRSVIDRVALVTSVSRFTRQKFLHWAKVDPALVKVLPNTVGAEFVLSAVPEAMRERYDVVGKKVLLTVSRLAASERYKGHELVMAALQTPILAALPLIYLIAGDGDDRARLQAVAKAAGLESRVRFIGYVGDTELPELFRLADVFVMPSSGEGFGIVFLQALASGCRVIAGNGDGSRDPLRDGCEGSLVSLAEPEQLAHVLLRSLQEGGARAAGAQVFSPANFSLQVQRLLQGLQERIAP